MIIFYEGLPRSGKSYEVTTKHILEALKNGRKVYAYIEGINHQKFSDVLNMPLAVVKVLLHQIESEQVQDIYSHVEDNSLVVIDELQDYFPSDREKLSSEMTEFITQHGHRGLDIICMGQDMRDCHSLWKRRVENKVAVLKKSGVGMENHYKWTMYKQTSPDKFEKITSGGGKYEEKYFGLYKSHTNNAINSLNYQDKRSVVWNTGLFKWGLPVALGVAVFSVQYLTKFFSTDSPMLHQAKAMESEKKNTKIITREVEPAKKEIQIKQAPVIQHPEEVLPIDYVDGYATKYRPRASGIIKSIKDGRLIGYIDFYDSSFHLKERLDFEQIQSLGWEVKEKEYGVDISKESVVHVVTSWPMDSFGRVSNHVRGTPQITGVNNY